MSEIECPESMKGHVQKVFNGEYNVPINVPVGSIILDIGANVGAFAIWAVHRWVGSIVHCYEPSKGNFDFLQKNTEAFRTNVVLNNFAIGEIEHTKLFKGKNNCGESSFFQLGEQMVDSETVETKSPSVLPKAQILKMDTEGCELEILKPLIESGRVFIAVMCEYHRERDRREIDRLLKDFTLVGAESTRQHRGIVKYVNKSIIK